MKQITFLKSVAVVALMLFANTVFAEQINVPDNATDTDLAAALDRAGTGDVIFIEGWVVFDAPVTVEKNVHFKGGENSGFDGQRKTNLFEIAPEVIEGSKLIFENLGFVDAYNDAITGSFDGDGGIGRIVSGTTEFIDCYFEDNVSGNRGGAFYVAEPETNVLFKNCDATRNKSFSTGGFMFSPSGNTTFEYCVIAANQATDQRGGAFGLYGGTHLFVYSAIRANESGVVGDLNGGEHGGGAFVTAGEPALTFISSSITGNTSHGDHGSALFIMDRPNITMINTTLAKNISLSGNGTFFMATSDVDLTFVNVVMAENEGTNSGNGGGGLNVMNTGNRINIFNSILVRNLCAESGEGAVDLRYSDTPNNEATTIVKNSIIGLTAGGKLPTIQDNPAIPTKSNINMYGLGGEAAQIDYFALDQSGVNFTDGLQPTVSKRLDYYTLKDNTVYAAKLGDPALLGDYDISTDVLGVERTIAADGSIFAGPIQSIVGDEPGEVQTAIKTISVPQSAQNIRIIGTVSNGILGVDYGDLKGRAKGELVSLTGQVVEKVFDLNVIGKGYYNVKTAVPGIYILKVTIGGQTYAQRVVVK